jgi:uncharacterized protein YndB with AHSA1/START domain
VVGLPGFTSSTCRMDFRWGGTTLVCMRSDQGCELYNTWTYRSIEPMDRIEFVKRFADSEGTTSPRPSSGYPLGSRVGARVDLAPPPSVARGFTRAVIRSTS